MTKHLDLDALVLANGGHKSAEEGMCVMEAVAFFAHEPFSDHPKCASTAITRFAMRLNDNWNDQDRQLLKPFIPQIVGTNTGRADEIRRGWLAEDWFAHKFAPLWLDRAGLTDYAAQLRALPPIDNKAAANSATALIRSARDAGWKKREEQRTRLYATLQKRPAAYAADAYAAAAYAAADAAADAPKSYETLKAEFRAKIDAILAPTLAETRKSALELLEAMIAVGRKELVEA